MKPTLILLLTSIAWAEDKPKEDIDQFQGTWTVSRMEINGKSQPQLFEVKVTFDGDKLRATVGKREPEPRGTFKLDPKRKPKGYEVTTPEGTVVPGIYELDGDTLKVCLASPGDPAPTDFKAAPGDGRTFLTYKRDKPAKAK